MRFGRSLTGLLGFAFATILVFWFALTGSRSAGVIINPGGVVGSNTAVLLGILLLVASGFWLGAKRLSDRFTSATSGVKIGNEEETLEALKRRYVAGEIDEAEFERQLETLFENESVEAAKRRVENTSTTPESPQESQTAPPVEGGSTPATIHQRRGRNTRSGHGRCK